MQELLQQILSSAQGETELRYHKRTSLNLAVQAGRLESATSVVSSGVGVRVLRDGCWGFSSTGVLTRDAIENALKEASISAEKSSGSKSEKVEALAPTPPAVGEFCAETDDPVEDHSTEEKLDLVVGLEEKIRGKSDQIVSAAVSFREMIDEKILVTTSGASARLYDVKPEFRVLAVAAKDGEMQTGFESSGVTGGWTDLFRYGSAEEMAENAAKLAVDLLSAGYPEGETATVILDPSLVGVLAHEAIGHTVEADFVQSGAITQGKIGEQVASELVTLADSGCVDTDPHAGGTLFVDDEGTPTREVVVIDRGVLRSYLHDRESAAVFGVEPPGNARAYPYSDAPLIRMRNTYLEPGEDSLDEMIAGVDEGYLMKGAGGGQADANAEFTFGVREAYRIRKGKVGELVRNATISGQGFEVLKSVDGASRDFMMHLGSGACGKFQPAKVDAGGPHIRCRAIVGGRHE